MFSSIDLSMVLAILPEISLLILVGLVLVFDMFWGKESKRSLGWLTAGGLLLIMIVSLLIGQPGAEPAIVWGGMLRFDWLGFVFKILVLFGAAITTLLAIDSENLGNRGEFYILLLVSTLGMNLMVSSADLIMLFLAIETTSVPLYVLAGFFRADKKSTEAGFKYLLFGAAASSVMLYGFSLLFGFSGSTNIFLIAQGLQAGVSTPLIVGTMLLVLVGFGFKTSVVPFHFWAPDVYEGAPTPVTGFLSTASKAAGFVVLMRVMMEAFPAIASQWGAVLAAVATATMTLGNTVALVQKNIKRMLAYSSIAHAGYILIGVVSLSRLGVSSAVFYLIAYLVTNLAAFGVVTVVSRVVNSDEIAAYAGLSRRSMGLSLVMMVAFLSLAGVPPLAGFAAKFWVFAAAVQSGLVWLAFVGVLNAIVGIYYYLIVLKVVYLYRSDDDDKPLPISRPSAIALAVLTLSIIVIGTVFAPWWGIANSAAAAIF